MLNVTGSHSGQSAADAKAFQGTKGSHRAWTITFLLESKILRRFVSGSAFVPQNASLLS